MESPVPLLSLAIYEPNPLTRTNHVVRACKTITDILPFDRKNHVLIEESELMKYLMLALPLNPKAIDEIITFMMKKFKSVHYFLKELWLGFIAVAQLEESENTFVKKSETAMRFYQNGVKKMLRLGTLRELDAGYDTPTHRMTDYCEPILKNKERIKLTVLEYVEKVIDLYFKELRHNVLFKPDIPDLLKKFISFSPSDKVIIKTCSILEKVAFAEKNPNLNHEVEQLVIVKKQQSTVFDSFSSRNHIESVRGKGKQVKINAPSISDLHNPDESGETPIRVNKQEIMLKRNMTMPTPKKGRDQTSIVMDSNQDATPAHENYNSVEYVVSQIDSWLASEDMETAPHIFKNINVHNLIKIEGNFEILLAFIFDPTCYKVGEDWKDGYPSLMEISNEISSNQQTPLPDVDPVSKLQKLQDEPSLQPYMMRSYKAMQALCEVKNIKYITHVDRRAFEKYFSFLYVTLATKEDSMCNFNHIAKVTEFLLTKESEVCVNYLIYYNLLYKFAQNIEFPYVQHFFLTLFNCSNDSTSRITEQAFLKISKYCEIVSFWGDTAKAILYGPHGFDSHKFHFDYKPNGIEALINGAIKPSDLEMLFGDSAPSTRAVNHDPLLENELNGFNLDIDALYTTVVSNKKKNNGQKSKVINDYENVPTPSKEIIQRYASLREKYKSTLGSSLADVKETDEKESQPSSNRNFRGDVKRISEKSETRLGTVPNDSRRNIAYQSKKNEVLSNPKSFIVKTIPDYRTFVPTKTTTKFFRPSTQQGATDGKRSISKQMLDPLRTDGFRSIKTANARSEDFGMNSLQQIRDQNMSVTSKQATSKQHLEVRRFFRETSKPEIITLATEYYNDGMTTEDAQMLNILYPLTCTNRIQTEVDKEARKPDFQIPNIKSNDIFSVPACELLDNLFRKALSTTIHDIDETSESEETMENRGKKLRHEMKKKLARPDGDYSSFWTAIFCSNSKLFSFLLKNYLFKIKIHHLEDINSGFNAGSIVNMILEKSETHADIKPFFKDIHAICQDNIKLLCKVIVQSHPWNLRPDKICIQNLEIVEPLGTGRILLAETLNWIIKHDYLNRYKIIQEINDTCWHTLILWFFNNLNNSIYHKIFYSIIETTFYHTDEKMILRLLLKLDVLSNMYTTYNQIFVNNVCIKDLHADSMIYYLRKLVNLIDTIAYDTEEYALLRSNLATSISWNDLRPKLCTIKREKKKTLLKASGRDSRRHSKMGTFVRDTASLSQISRVGGHKATLNPLNPRDLGFIPSSRGSVSRGSINNSLNN